MYDQLLSCKPISSDIIKIKIWVSTEFNSINEKGSVFSTSSSNPGEIVPPLSSLSA